MSKLLITSKEDLEKFKAQINKTDKYLEQDTEDMEDPKEYPVILVWDIVGDTDLPNALYCEYVYKRDLHVSHFYLFEQNNSEGKFQEDKKLCMFVVIEACSAKHANRLAKNLGIYFDGVKESLDCHCCGDRWSRATEPLRFPRLIHTAKFREDKLEFAHKHPELRQILRYVKVPGFIQSFPEVDFWADNLDAYLHYRVRDLLAFSGKARVFYLDGRVQEYSLEPQQTK